MMSIPISFVTAVLLAVLALRLWIKEDHQGPFFALLLVCAGQMVIMTLAHHYGVWAARWVMPITACIIPPLAFVAFEAMRGGRIDWAWSAMLVAVCGALILRLAIPALLDIWIPALFGVVAGLIIWRTGRKAEFKNVNLAAADQPRVFWRWIAGMLIISALSDVVIFALLAGAAPAHKFMAITLMSSLNLLVLGAFVFFTDGNFVPFVERPVQRVVGEQSTSDNAMAQITSVMMKDHIYLDPELSVARLARRVGLPMRDVSFAINQATGENVSRYINRLRIEHAQALLSQGQPVTEALYQSGFNTKSNFNREFLRVTGQTPSAWKNDKKS